MRYLFLVSLLILVSCTPAQKAAYTGIKQQAVQNSQEKNDEFLSNTEFLLCNAPTIGAVKRKYSGNMDKYKEFYDFCDHDTPLGN